MDDFCWLTGPGLCGTLNFTLSVVDILFTVLVSGLVTFATIHFSTKSAREQTEKAIAKNEEATARTLATSKIESLRSAVYGLSVSAETAFREVNTGWHYEPMWLLPRITLATSNVPYAHEAVYWASLLTTVSMGQIGREEHDLCEFAPSPGSGPGDMIGVRLDLWLDEPEIVGRNFKHESEAMIAWVSNVQPLPNSEEL